MQADLLGVQSAAAVKAVNLDPATVAAAKQATLDIVQLTGKQANSMNEQISQQGAAAGK